MHLKETARHDIKTIQYKVPLNSEGEQKHERGTGSGAPLKGVGGDLGGVRRPVRRREGHAPEVWRRLDEFEAYLGSSVRRGTPQQRPYL